MKAKKFLALLLATLMLALACPLTAFASDNYIAEVTVYNPYLAENDKTKVTNCTTWDEVKALATEYNAAKPLNDYNNRKNIIVTIKILVPELTVHFMDCNVTLIVDGEYAANQYANLTCGNGYFVKNNNNVTLKNFNMNMTFASGKLLIVNTVANAAEAVTNIENVNFLGSELLSIGTQHTSVKKVNVRNTTVTLNDYYAAEMASASDILFDNCTITKAAGKQRDVFYTSGNLDSELTLNNTTVTQNGGNGGWVYSNVVSHSGTGKLTVNLTGTTRINHNSDQTNTGGGSCMFFGWDHPMELNVGANAILNMGPAEGENVSGAYTLPSFFRRFSELTVNDEGGTWKADESYGNFRGYWNDGNGSATDIDGIIGFTKDGAIYDEFNLNIPAGDEYKTMTEADVKAAVTNGFGASIRTVDPDGIRFRTNFDKDFYDLYKNSAVFGAKVTTKDNLIAAGADFAAAVGLTTPTGDALNWDSEGETLITVLTNIGSDKYDVIFYVTGFITVTYANNTGKTVTVYADYNEAENARSIKGVAQAALNDAENGVYSYSAAQLAYIEAIVNA
jgi:hypothetical protein